MARARYSNVAQGRNAANVVSVIPNATVTVYQAGTTTPISASLIFAGDTGATTKTNPFSAAADGSFEFFLATSQRVKVTVAGTGFSTATLDLEGVFTDPGNYVDRTAPGTIAGVTLTSPVITTPTGDIATKTGTETLTNKTFTAPVVNDPRVTHMLAMGPDDYDLEAYCPNKNGSLNAISGWNTMVAAAMANKGEIHIGGGWFAFNAPLTMSGATGMRVSGRGQGASTLGWIGSGGNVLDLAGVSNCTFEDFQVQLGAANPAAIGLFVGAVAGAPSTACTFKRIGVSNPAWTGAPSAWTIAPLVVYGGGDHQFDHCNFDQHLSTATVPTMILTANSGYSVTTTVGTLSGGQCSDLHFNKCEYHQYGTNAFVVILDGTGGLQFTQGVMANSGPSAGARGTAHIGFKNVVNNTQIDNVTMESESGIAPIYCFYNLDSNPVQGLSVRQSNFTAFTAIFGGVGGTRRNGVEFFLGASGSSTAPSLMSDSSSGAGAGATHLQYSVYHCGGLPVTSSGQIEATVHFFNPGTITVPSPGQNLAQIHRSGTTANEWAAGNHAHTGTVTGSESSMRMIRGRYFSTVAGAARLDSGSGFTLSRNGTGDVTINFSTAFTQAPAVIANCEVVAGTLNRAAVVSTVTASSFRIQTYNAGAASDEEVDFLAVGV